MVKNHFNYLFILISLITLSACGGDSSSSSESILPTKKNYSISVIGGYLESATVWLDINHNGKKDTNEPQNTTNKYGKSTLSLHSSIDPNLYSVIVYAKEGKTFDYYTNSYVKNDFILSSPKGINLVTPITTLIYFNEKQTGDKNKAIINTSSLLGINNENLFKDYLADNDKLQEKLSSDLIRLRLLPTSEINLISSINNPSYFLKEIENYLSLRIRDGKYVSVVRDSKGNLAQDTDLDNIADMEDDDIDGDNIINIKDKFPYNKNEWEDIDNDGIGNNSDNDIDGDGINNENDKNPESADFNTIENPGTLHIDTYISGHISENNWQYFTIKSPKNIMLNIELSNLSGDVDLYINTETPPNKYDYLCRSNLSYNKSEKCIEKTNNSSTYYIGLFSREDASFTLSAKKGAIVYKKAMLLLHGLASNTETWKPMINDQDFFHGKCQNITANTISLSESSINNKGISCFNLEFGTYDRGSKFTEWGLDNKKCNRVSGCNGDYTTFKGLGYEVASAVDLIRSHLGDDTEVFLFGHSRGGLAARSYLQNTEIADTSIVKGFATTGTPHQGSPLGRFYQYMNTYCVPKIAYRQDNGKCEDNWEVIELLNGTRKFFGIPIKPDDRIDLQAPSINFLSPDSKEISDLNHNLTLLDGLIMGQLVYQGTRFGLIAKDILFKFDYDLYKYRGGFGDHPHPSTLTYIENGKKRIDFFGDGIVPAYSQKLNLLLNKEKINITNSWTISSSKILHTEETSQISDIYILFNGLYPTLGWHNE